MKKRKFIVSNKIIDIVAIVIALLAFLYIGTLVCLIIFSGVRNIPEALQTQELKFAIKTSLFTASISSLLVILIAIPTSYALNKTNLPFKRFISSVIEIPMVLPLLVIGVSLLMFFTAGPGGILREWGIKVIFDVKGIIVAQMTVNIPYGVRLVNTAFKEIDNKYDYVAGLLGASKFYRFRTITLPLAKSTLLSAFILVWSRGLGEFGATLMLVGATRLKTETLPTNIYLSMATGDIDMAMASASIMLLISFTSIIVVDFIGRKKKGTKRLEVENEQH